MVYNEDNKTSISKGANQMINQSIEMVVFTDKTGIMQPLRFRITDENGTNQVVKIEKYQERKEDFFSKGKRIFDCLVILNDTKRKAEIWYDKASMKWLLYNPK